MRVKKPFRNAVRIIVVIHMFMMTPMFARPHQNRVFKRSGTKNKCEKPDRPACLEGNVREKPMITFQASWPDRKSTRLNSSHSQISYAVFCLKKKKKKEKQQVMYKQIQMTCEQHQ